MTFTWPLITQLSRTNRTDDLYLTPYYTVVPNKQDWWPLPDPLLHSCPEQTGLMTFTWPLITQLSWTNRTDDLYLTPYYTVVPNQQDWWPLPDPLLHSCPEQTGLMTFTWPLITQLSWTNRTDDLYLTPYYTVVLNKQDWWPLSFPLLHNHLEQTGLMTFITHYKCCFLLSCFHQHEIRVPAKLTLCPAHRC